MEKKHISVTLTLAELGEMLVMLYIQTFSHERRDGVVKYDLWDRRVVGHWVVLHDIKGRQLHDLVDDVIR